MFTVPRESAPGMIHGIINANSSKYLDEAVTICMLDDKLNESLARRANKSNARLREGRKQDPITGQYVTCFDGKADLFKEDHIQTILYDLAIYASLIRRGVNPNEILVPKEPLLGSKEKVTFSEFIKTRIEWIDAFEKIAGPLEVSYNPANFDRHSDKDQRCPSFGEVAKRIVAENNSSSALE